MSTDLDTLVVTRVDPTLHGGAAERVRNIVRALADRGSVRVVVLRHPPPDGPVHPVAGAVDWLGEPAARSKPWCVAAMVLGVHTRRQGRSNPPLLRERVVEHLEDRPDLLWAVTDVAALALPPAVGIPTVLDLIDFEGRRDREIARRVRTRDRVARVLAALDARALRTSLARIARQVDVVVVSSEADRAELGLPEVAVVANSYQLVGQPAGEPAEERGPSLLFNGLMTYEPNADGARWLVEEVWPEVRSAHPTAELRLVGPGSSELGLGDAGGVVAVGPVPAMAAELARATATLVPLRIGSGTRVKILESWAHRVPVVSTTIGAEGLGAQDDRELLIGDSPHEFAAAICRVLEDPVTRTSLADAGEARWASQFSPSATRRRVHELLDRVLVGAG